MHLAEERRWACAAGHSFDIARQGYVNLLAGAGRRRAGGDSTEMVAARRFFLATGAYERISDHVNHEVARALTAAAEYATVLDVGCGEGYYTRRLGAALADTARVCGVDLAKPAVAAAAVSDPTGLYAVASAFDLPLPPASADVVINVFGPIAPEELARVVRPSGSVVIVHPGPRHLFALRELVYEQAAPHEPKNPLRAVPDWFRPAGTVTVAYPLSLTAGETAQQLLAMTPYRWHAPRHIEDRLATLETEVDVMISSYRRVDLAPYGPPRGQNGTIDSPM